MSEKLDKLRAMLKKEQERRIKLNNRIAVLERRIQERRIFYLARSKRKILSSILQASFRKYAAGTIYNIAEYSLI